jgi:LAO/AO transport system kinase
VFAVNKADREGADRTVRDLQTMLELRRTVAARPAGQHDAAHRFSGEDRQLAPPGPGEWEPPIVRTVAVKSEGISDLARAIERHREHLQASGERRARETARARAAFVSVLRERLLAGALDRLEAEMGHLEAVAERIAAREADPYALADELAARLRG